MKNLNINYNGGFNDIIISSRPKNKIKYLELLEYLKTGEYNLQELSVKFEFVISTLSRFLLNLSRTDPNLVVSYRLEKRAVFGHHNVVSKYNVKYFTYKDTNKIFDKNIINSSDILLNNVFNKLKKEPLTIPELCEIFNVSYDKMRLLVHKLCRRYNVDIAKKHVTKQYTKQITNDKVTNIKKIISCDTYYINEVPQNEK